MKRSLFATTAAAAVTTAAALGAPLSAVRAAPAPVELIGTGVVPGTAKDGLVLTPALLEDGVTPHDQIGGFGSGLAYTGVGTSYLAVPDRGPADGTTSYRDRAYLFDIVVTPGAAQPVTIALRSATLLSNEEGQPLTGSAAAFDATNSPASLRFDPEAVRISGGGSFYVSDEYGPFVYEFDAEGRRLRAIPLPPRFLIAAANALPANELPPGNSSGRQANRGMEGLAVSPDGRKLFGLMQNALIQDGALDPTNRRVGLNTRLLEVDLKSGQTREYVYQLDRANRGLNELVAINDTQFLVVERDGDGGVKAAAKLIYKIDITGATDVSAVPALPTTGLPAGVVPVAKTLLIDMLDPAFGLAGPDFPEKIEGLALGPSLPDGRRLLLVSHDNDFKGDQPSKVYAFAIDPALLAGFTPQMLQPRIELRPIVGRGPAFGLPGAPLPVVFFGDAFFPVSAIDGNTIRVAGAPPLKLAILQLCQKTDFDDDGFEDLVCLIDGNKIDLPAGKHTVEITATTTTATPIKQWDDLVLPRRR